MLFHHVFIAPLFHAGCVFAWYRDGLLLAATFPFAVLHKLGGL